MGEVIVFWMLIPCAIEVHYEVHKARLAEYTYIPE